MSTTTDRSRTTLFTSSQAGHAAEYVDDRSGISVLVREFGRKIFPDHWSFMLGEMALYTLVICIATGTFLTFWYAPGSELTTYHGSFAPLYGQQMSEAYETTIHLSFDVRGGLLMRQIHHWSALLFVASILAHMARVFVTGAFRKPRELNWVLGATLAVTALAEGFTGYSLPDDLLSGNGLRIIYAVIESVPVFGTYLAFFIFGGQFPGSAIISRLFIFHVMIVPAILLAVVGLHLAFVVLHKHTQYPAPGRTNDNVVGYPVLPVYAAKAGGFFFIVFGVVAIIASFVTINPVWNYGPYDPTPISAGTQPDWYIFFVDGALRLMPGHLGSVPTEFTFWGHTWTLNIFLPGLVLPVVLIMFLFAYPFVEAWVTGDHRDHNILDRPRNNPTRTGIGVAALVFYLVISLAATNDIIATHFHLSINDITYTLRTFFFIGPPIGFWVTKRFCMGLQRRDHDLALHGRESGRIVRTATGEYFEVHEPLSSQERWALVQHEDARPVELPPGRSSLLQKIRSRVSYFYYEDRVDPVTPDELEAAHHEGGQEGEAIADHPGRPAAVGSAGESAPPAELGAPPVGYGGGQQ